MTECLFRQVTSFVAGLMFDQVNDVKKNYFKSLSPSIQSGVTELES